MSAFYDRGYESCGKTEQKLTDFFFKYGESKDTECVERCLWT